MITDDDVKDLFDLYEGLCRQALGGEVDVDRITSLFAAEFIGAAPQGVLAGRNDAQLGQAIAREYVHHRKVGTKEMRIRDLRVSPLDEYHCVAHVGWTAVYARDKAPDLPIDFEVHYFLQKIGDEPKIFGWVSGDAEALLKAHGII